MSVLLHMTTAAEWRAALEGGQYSAPSLDQEGFLHLSTADQVHLPANAIYAGRDDLVLLCVDPSRAGSEIRWEPGQPADPAGMSFPHLYGALPTNAVFATVPYLPGRDGRFGRPMGIPSVADSFARKLAFDRSVLIRRAAEVRPVTGGFAVLDPAFPRSYDNNRMWLADPVPTEVVVAEADAVLGRAGLAHRQVTLTHPDSAKTVAGLAELGWEIEEQFAMALRGPELAAFDRPVTGAAVVDAATIQRLWSASWREVMPDAPGEDVRQLVDREPLNDRVVRVLDVGAPDTGEIGAGAQLRIDGSSASLEAVLTLSARRGNGLADAAVRTAMHLATEAGCDLVTLDADAGNWPKTWYSRLGFRAVGRTWTATRKPG